MKVLIRNLLLILLFVAAAVYIRKVYYNPDHLKAVARDVRESTQK